MRGQIVGLAITLVLLTAAAPDGMAQGRQGPPPGIQGNPGFQHGQGDTQGNHYGWDKHREKGHPEKQDRSPKGSHEGYGKGHSQQGYGPPPGHEPNRQGWGPPPGHRPGHRQGWDGEQQGYGRPGDHHGKPSWGPPPQRHPGHAGGQGPRRHHGPPPGDGQFGQHQGPRLHKPGPWEVGQRPSESPGHGKGPKEKGPIPGNAYGNGKIRGNGGQMGQGHKP